MRLALPALLLAAFATAAPMPVDKAAERKALGSHWNELWSADAVKRTKAVFALVDHPGAVEFLAEKLPPLDATAEQLKAWVKDLNDPNENVWQAAVNQLWYHDPRTQLSAVEQLDLVTTNNGRRLLASVWWGWLYELRPDTIRVTLTLQRIGGQWYTLSQEFPDGSGGTGIRCAPVAEIVSPSWQRAATAAHILRRTDTSTSRAALERLATGHQDALPTRTAAALLKAKAPISKEQLLADLLTNDPVATTRGAFALFDTPGAVGHLKAELRPTKADKEQIKKWLKSLDDDDAEVWKPALQKLLYHHPLLALSWEELCDAVTTDHGRSVLFWLSGSVRQVPERIEVYPDCTLSPLDDGLRFSYPAGGGQVTGNNRPGTLATLNPPHWQRARLAIIALERMKTDDAKAVLKQLADGHPDILPTKEAKAALERLK